MEGPLVAEIIKNLGVQNGHIGCMKAMNKNSN